MCRAREYPTDTYSFENEMQRRELELPPKRARAIENIQVPQLICISERHVIDTHAASQIRRCKDTDTDTDDVLADAMRADIAVAVVGSFIWLGACGSDSITDCL